jgi:negative regulator of flagellin synthesis FlgM
MEINSKSPLVDLSTRLDRIDIQDQMRQKFQKAGQDAEIYDPDRVELSVQSRKIQHLDELIRATPDVRDDRVEQVRRSIENGTYNVKAEQVADKILCGNAFDEIF